MSDKIFLKAAPDGIVQSLILFLSAEYTMSVYSSNQSVIYQLFFISGLCAILSATIYFLFLMKETCNKRIAFFSLSSILWFILTVVVILIILIAVPTILQNQFPISVFPLREEVNNADGIWMMFVTGAFILFSFVLKLILFLTFIIRNMYKTKGKKSSKE